MKDLISIKKEISQMAELTLKMWRTTFQTFMEHDAGLIGPILQDEDTLNNLEKQITDELIEWARFSKDNSDIEKASIYRDVVADLELIGDYCKDILERIEIKIEEKLLFSEDSVKEYTELYRKTEAALDEIALAFEKDSFSLVKEVLKKEEHIDSLVDDYRHRHNERMIRGLCSPMGCNMFLNMLDFTAAVYYHAKKIARNLLKIK